jgi:hypothetical protein
VEKSFRAEGLVKRMDTAEYAGRHCVFDQGNNAK